MYAELLCEHPYSLCEQRKFITAMRSRTHMILNKWNTKEIEKKRQYMRTSHTTRPRPGIEKMTWVMRSRAHQSQSLQRNAQPASLCHSLSSLATTPRRRAQCACRGKRIHIHLTKTHLTINYDALASLVARARVGKTTYTIPDNI